MIPIIRDTVSQKARQELLEARESTMLRKTGTMVSSRAMAME